MARYHVERTARRVLTSKADSAITATGHYTPPRCVRQQWRPCAAGSRSSGACVARGYSTAIRRQQPRQQGPLVGVGAERTGESRPRPPYNSTVATTGCRPLKAKTGFDVAAVVDFASGPPGVLHRPGPTTPREALSAVASARGRGRPPQQGVLLLTLAVTLLAVVGSLVDGSEARSYNSRSRRHPDGRHELAGRARPGLHQPRRADRWRVRSVDDDSPIVAPPACPMNRSVCSFDDVLSDQSLAARNAGPVVSLRSSFTAVRQTIAELLSILEDAAESTGLVQGSLFYSQPPPGNRRGKRPAQRRLPSGRQARAIVKPFEGICREVVRSNSYPEIGQNEFGEYRYLSGRQSITYVYCMFEGETCPMEVSLYSSRDFTRCVQKFGSSLMVVFDEKTRKLSNERILVPCGCQCQHGRE